ncbi:unnamed protein product, partial [Effrenium voratum]
RRFTEAAEAEDRARRGRRKVRARGDGADVAGRAGAGTGARAVPAGGRAGAEGPHLVPQYLASAAVPVRHILPIAVAATTGSCAARCGSAPQQSPSRLHPEEIQGDHSDPQLGPVLQR